MHGKGNHIDVVMRRPPSSDARAYLADSNIIRDVQMTLGVKGNGQRNWKYNKCGECAG